MILTVLGGLKDSSGLLPRSLDASGGNWENFAQLLQLTQQGKQAREKTAEEVVSNLVEREEAQNNNDATAQKKPEGKNGNGLPK